MPVAADEFRAIAALPVFQKVDEGRIRRLTDAGFLQTFPKHTILFDQGQDADFLYVLIQGSVELFARTGDDDRSVTIEVLAPVETFILAAAVTDMPYLMGARVLAPSRILMVSSALLRQLIGEDNNLAIAMMMDLARQFRAMVRQVKNLKLRTSVERTGCYLMLLAETHAQDTTFKLPYDKRTLAGRLGMTPEHLSRAFGALRDYGVNVSGQTVHIEDPAAFRAAFALDRLLDAEGNDFSSGNSF